MTTTSYTTVGKRIGQVEGVAKVTGRAAYTADVDLPGALWGRVLRSPYPHARIVSLDTTAARQLPGVLPLGNVPGGMESCGLYRVPNVHIDNIGVYTNCTPRGHSRAPGGPWTCR